MVDVSDKAVTRRTACARAVVQLPREVASRFHEGELRTKKGPVIQTAILAGIMAAKKTSELIPLCHPIALEDCSVEIAWGSEGELIIECHAVAEHKTGVEMEALMGATVAALTVYDMCKGLSPDIVIRETRLVEKHGGKRDFVLRA
jgi:cyclic pyranopterin phosphate synthase